MMSMKDGSKYPAIRTKSGFFAPKEFETHKFTDYASSTLQPSRVTMTQDGGFRSIDGLAKEMKSQDYKNIKKILRLLGEDIDMSAGAIIQQRPDLLKKISQLFCVPE